MVVQGMHSCESEWQIRWIQWKSHVLETMEKHKRNTLHEGKQTHGQMLNHVIFFIKLIQTTYFIHIFGNLINHGV